MPDSSDQTIRRLQQENKKLKKTLEQKGKELDLERGLWKTRHDIDIPVDAGRAALLHRLETLDGIVSDEALLHAATLHSREEFEYILERFEEAIIKSEDAPLFRNNEVRSGRSRQPLQPLSKARAPHVPAAPQGQSDAGNS